MAGPHRFHPHLPGRGYTFLAKGVGAMMWFFIFYRLRCVQLYPSPGLDLRKLDISDKTAASSWATILSWITALATTIMATHQMPDIIESHPSA
ncbi:hypothetical protein MVEN_00521800 [Mycena venus]|uniref:Uncharacterized protein n=1 Tax=Mycena venus TaxID=2733690 RepID=A0A8H6YP29_9AGAR|nr:hypothetical protein MVEN_00521800 [Mycena venus]